MYPCLIGINILLFGTNLEFLHLYKNKDGDIEYNKYTYHDILHSVKINSDCIHFVKLAIYNQEVLADCLLSNDLLIFILEQLWI